MTIASDTGITYQRLGAHVDQQDGMPGTRFAVWAPNALAVSVIGDFNGWSPELHPMAIGGPPGVWGRFIPHVGAGSLYKYAILPRGDDRRIEKADPCAFAAELPPGTASRVWDLGGYRWGDADWMARRADANPEYFLYAGALILIGVVLFGINRIVAGRTGTIDPTQLRG